MKIHGKHVTSVFDWKDTQSFRAWSITASSSSPFWLPCNPRSKLNCLDDVLRDKDCPAISFQVIDQHCAVLHSLS
jgi:hypothetical protein